MRTRLSAILLTGFFALSLVACDDILLPDDPFDPGNGGGQDTTWNPGDTIGDDDTTGGIDTTGNHSQLVVNGTFRSYDQDNPGVPDGARLTVIWFRADGTSVAYGNGELLPNNKWRITVGGQLPTNAYWGDPYGEHTFAVGQIALVDGDIVTGIPGQIGGYGTTGEFNIIYDTNKPTADAWGVQFLDIFPRGYMLGEMVDNGQIWMPPYVPVRNDDVQLWHSSF